MPFSPPSGVTLHTSGDVPLAVLSAMLQRVLGFFQNQKLSPLPSLRLYDDWWEHDGLHFEKGRATFDNILAMVKTPQALFETTPGEDEVFAGIAPEDGVWYLRFRAEWDADDQNVVGRFAVTVPLELSEAFRNEVVAVSQSMFVEEPSDIYYRRVIVPG